MEGFGEAMPPQDLYFLVVVAGFAGNHHQKEMILGGPAALQTSRLAGDCVTRVIVARFARKTEHLKRAASSIKAHPLQQRR
jgi:hypothetical protein